MQTVTVILCVSFLIKDVLPVTTGLVAAKNKKLRLCVSKEGQSDKIKNSCVILGIEDSGVECVEGKDRVECLRNIYNGLADFGVFNPEDLVAAQADDDAIVIAEIRTTDRPFQRYVVAVVDHSVLVDRPGRLHAVLKDRVLCHPGTDVGDFSAYSKTLNGYLEFLVQQPSECSNDENRIKTLADYFGRSCKAGPWVPDRLRDNELKRQYSSLCAACGSGTCSAKDRYWGALGALACVVEVGEVAWAELSHVESFFSGAFFGLLSNRDGPYRTPERFALLCPDYSSQAIANSTESCVWLHQPWPTIVSRSNKILSVEKLTKMATSSKKTSGFWLPALQTVLEMETGTLTPLEYPLTVRDFLGKARGFLDAYSVQPCKEEPKKTFKCDDGAEISQYKMCDGIKDCADGSDETFRTCRRNACADNMFRCAYGGCLDAEAECNGKIECPDGSDELEDLCGKPAPTTEHTVTSKPTNESENLKCVLPEYPAYGIYLVTDYPSAVPGQAFNSVHYTVSCSNGYNVIGDKKDRICYNGIWSNEIGPCVRFCSLPKHHSVEYRCYLSNNSNEFEESSTRICDTNVPEGTIVKPECQSPNYYFPGALKNMRCVDGSWDYVAKCLPECGFISVAEGELVFGGRLAGPGELPWHAVIYSKRTVPYMQICGGSIVTSKVVISAAHCFWHDIKRVLFSASIYSVAVGKQFRDYGNSQDVEAQKSDIEEIHVPESFRGQTTKLESDIAVVILQQSITFNSYVRPVCIDFNVLFETVQLKEGSIGKIATWGQQTQQEGMFKTLRVLKLPYVSTQDCLADSPEGFKSYITSDKICAGYRNGSSICVGDSGGGLAFPEHDRGRTRYYLRGVASAVPRRKIEEVCILTWLTTFTKISKHQTFLRQYLSGS